MDFGDYLINGNKALNEGLALIREGKKLKAYGQFMLAYQPFIKAPSLSELMRLRDVLPKNEHYKNLTENINNFINSYI